MSRFEFDEYENEFPNQGEFWARSLKTALTSKRGRQALSDLREALLALPEKRLISRALCTVGVDLEADAYGEKRQLVEDQGEGVCAVGAYIWGKRVKEGMDPAEAFASLPMLPDYDHGSWETADQGRAAGLALTLASDLAYRNDETYSSMTPEQRYAAFMAWLDDQLIGFGADRV